MMKWCLPPPPRKHSQVTGGCNSIEQKCIFNHSHLLLLYPSDIYINTLFMVLIPVSDGGDIKCDSECVRACARACALMCMQMAQEGRGGDEAAYFVCGLHISDSAERPPSMRRIYICRSRNNLKPMVMLTLVHTRFHVALLHDYICVGA